MGARHPVRRRRSGELSFLRPRRTRSMRHAHFPCRRRGRHRATPDAVARPHGSRGDRIDARTRPRARPRCRWCQRTPASSRLRRSAPMPDQRHEPRLWSRCTHDLREPMARSELEGERPRAVDLAGRPGHDEWTLQKPRIPADFFEAKLDALAKGLRHALSGVHPNVEANLTRRGAARRPPGQKDTRNGKGGGAKVRMSLHASIGQLSRRASPAECSAASLPRETAD